MKILFVAAEVAPFVSVGGLSQVTYFLPKALRSLGHDVRIFTAKYGEMDSKKDWKLKMEVEHMPVPIDENPRPEESLICNVKSFTDVESRITAYFLENREYYELRANVFGYKDDHVRFALLSKGCLEWLMKAKEEEKWWPDIIHVHDWHTSYLIDLAKRTPRYRNLFSKIPMFLTAHNFHFQGNYDFRYSSKDEYDFGKTNIAPLNSKLLQRQNALKRGLLFADAVNTVSPTHAVEVLTPEYAEGLEDTLMEIKNKLNGILNGLDTTNFDPKKDISIKRKFNATSFSKEKTENKKELQKFFDLPVDKNKPILAFCGRLSKQKGLDLILEVMPHLFLERKDLQIVIIGSGDDRYRLELEVLQKNFPDHVGLHLRPDFMLPRKMFAGSDMILIPSVFEPGGIVALEALRYGCVPIVRRTGGLNDIVTDFNPATKTGNGFSFKNNDAWSLFGTIAQALTVYNFPKTWKTLVENCMAGDFSWNHAALEYEKWYEGVLNKKINN